MIWKPPRKEIFDIFFSSVIRKNLKQENAVLKFAEASSRQLFYIMHNLLYEAKVTNVTCQNFKGTFQN